MSEHMARIEEQAAAWTAKIDGGNWSPADEAELEVWLAADSRHAGALLRMQSLWLAADKSVAADEPREHSEPGRWLSRRKVVAGAAMAGLAASLGAAFFISSGRQYSTGIGEILRVPLEDGSMAAIDTDTRMTVQLSKSLRRVTLLQGQVWFKVAKDRARPFVVEAGSVRVRAVGTAFAVHRTEVGAEILVTEGVVEAWLGGGEQRAIRLTAGQQAVLGPGLVERLQATAPAAANRTLAWRDGKINLANTTLTDAAAEFNRYNSRRIVIADPAIGTERFDGVFGTDDPMGFALAVRDSLTVPIDLSDPNVIEIGRGGP